LTSSEEVTRGKPAPDVLLLSAERLNVIAEDCLVIEDSRNGMLAAAAANMPCIGLVSDVLGHYPTKLLVNRLDQVPNYIERRYV
jgi:beta-phosphoglucomutase-like phosphatase (HAD superfamily)